MLKLLTKRHKVFNGILSARPALYLSTTRDTKSFLVAQPIFLSIIAFVKERFHNAVEIDILGIFEGYS